MTPSLEGWPTKAKEAPSPHKVRMSPLDINPVFQSLGGEMINQKIAVECLDNLILNAINTIRKKKIKNVLMLPPYTSLYVL